MSYILEVQRSSRDPAEILSTINDHGGKAVPVPPNRRLRGVATIAVFSTLVAARQAAETLAPVETMIVPTKIRLDLKLDADTFYLSVASSGQTCGEIIDAIETGHGEIICLQNGKVSGIFPGQLQAAAVAVELNERGIEAIVFSRREARRAREDRRQRAAEGPSVN